MRFLLFAVAFISYVALCTAFAFRANQRLRSTLKLSRSSLEPINSLERTYIMIKPDGVQRGIVGEIIQRFERKGLSLQGLKLVAPSEDILRRHYEHLSSKPFFPKLVEFMTSGPVIAMVWEGKHAVRLCRTLLGSTDPSESQPGTIRGDLAIDVGRNVCHGSDSVESAQREIALWFEEGLPSFRRSQNSWIYE